MTNNSWKTITSSTIQIAKKIEKLEKKKNYKHGWFLNKYLQIK